MERKIVMNPEDFEKLMNYLSIVPVPFALVEKAAEAKEAIKRAQAVDIKVEKPAKPADIVKK